MWSPITDRRDNQNKETLRQLLPCYLPPIPWGFMGLRCTNTTRGDPKEAHVFRATLSRHLRLKRCSDNHRCATFCHHDPCYASPSSSSASLLKRPLPHMNLQQCFAHVPSSFKFHAQSNQLARCKILRPRLEACFLVIQLSKPSRTN